MAQDLNIDDLLSKHPSRFESEPFHSPEGDSIHWYFENVDHYADRVDCWLTVYKAFDDHRLVGFKLKNIKTMQSMFQSMGLSVAVSGREWTIELQAALAYRPWLQPHEFDAQPYRELIPKIPATETVELAK